ncbi:hypothetical protein [[Clostridium] scindens]|uniref:hypothetical protein n=1 Tax=Clostridium scindens (strain JCM 10418 / VPI 12708) TaxID=29347 RepID=UPI0024309BA4|nr:hypothetical protein [[Clostridium] scindens]
MSVYGLFIAYRHWKEKPCLDTFIGLYKSGFNSKCKWSAPRKLYCVIKNLITGKYERFYEYYSVGEIEGDSMSDTELKPRMTLDEAIEHCKEKADCTKCGMEHRQLAEWLIELKNRRNDMERIVEQLEKMGNIKFSSFSKPLIAVEDVIEIVKGGAE